MCVRVCWANAYINESIDDASSWSEHSLWLLFTMYLLYLYIVVAVMCTLFEVRLHQIANAFGRAYFRFTVDLLHGCSQWNACQ